MWPRTSVTRCTVEPDTEPTPKRSGSWCTTMITATPARNPVMIGAERKLAIQPMPQQPHQGHEARPTITAKRDTSAM